MQNIEIPVTEGVYKRLCKRDREDPKGYFPFIFREKEEEENDTYDHVFIVVHGCKEGGILHPYTSLLGEYGHIDSLPKFIELIKKIKPKLNKFNEIVLICCHGAVQEQVKGVTILNKSDSEIFTSNSKMCAYIDETGNDAYSFTITGIDGAFY